METTTANKAYYEQRRIGFWALEKHCWRTFLKVCAPCRTPQRLMRIQNV